ncbi:MAG: FkbM family methyltransferase [Chitinophagaceae bacterium]|nr:FkbM family methyltransferase [Chitinophagaceae bacterium]
MTPFFRIEDIASLPGFEFESPCRHYANYAYLENNMAICRVLTRYKIYIDTRDRGIAPHLIMDGFWETWLTQYLAKIIKPGDICLDIGANVGYFSVLMSALSGDTGRTIAVEPNPDIAKLLRLTSGLNGPGFEVSELALADKEGKLRLRVPEDSFGDASIINRVDRLIKPKSSFKVRTTTLDIMLRELNLSKVDVIKMDVEGAEPFVFEGMKETIANNKDLQIIIEYSPFLYDNPRAFTEYLFSEFTVRRIKDVEQIEDLDESAIETLITLTDHTDLYLSQKNEE